jgi:NHLM bacteriocin system ABC transporter peptidase/ATP-binding protein
MNTIQFPAIIFWEFNHFVVLEGFKGESVYINDPAHGRRILSWNDFDKSFTGISLEFSKGPDFKPVGTKYSIIPDLFDRIKSSRDILTFVILIGLFLILPGFVIPAFSSFFVDRILVHSMKSFLKPLLIGMALTAGIEYILTWMQQKYLLRFETKMALIFSSRFLDHILRLPIDFFNQRFPGELTNRILSNDTVAELLSSKLTTVVISLFSVLFYIILMLQYDVLLTLMCICMAAINFVILKAISEKLKNCTFKLQQESGKLFGISTAGISMIETLKSSGSENDFFMQWSGQQSKVVLERQKMAVISQTTLLLPDLITKTLNLLVLAVGAQRIMSGHMTIGMLVAFQTLQSSFINPVNTFLGLGSELQSGAADIKRIDDVMRYPEVQKFKKTDGKERYKPFSKLEGCISLKDVTFGYNKLEDPLITNFDLVLKPGSRVALVGGSGSGKTTVVKLISGLYEPWKGEVLFDGKPFSEIDRDIFYASFSMVDQNIFLFEGTIKDNLTMWDTAISEDDYIRAAKDACIHELISSRKDGYYGRVEEMGKNFSGGQRQRLEIARALATNPRILVMDEATSALDAVTEREVDENIRRRGCTCIIVAHRLSTIRDCDEIVVLDQGKIVQRGTHDTLVAEKGLYKDLIKTM